MKLDKRKEIILASVFENFIESGEPVGSKSIQMNSNLGVSSATIRNEMFQLEALGYFEQIHKSSGRILSSKGYRYYIDEIMQPYVLDEKSKVFIEDEIEKKQPYGSEKVLKYASELLSELTDLTCVVHKANIEDMLIRNIKLVEVNDFTVLLVILTHNGVVQNSLIKLSTVLDHETVNKFNKFFESNFMNKTIEEATKFINSDMSCNMMNFSQYTFNNIVSAVERCVDDSKKDRIFLEGVTKLLKYSPYEKGENLKKFFDFINKKHNIEALLSTFNKSDIKIGDENSIDAVKEFVVITKLYNQVNDVNGKIAIIGPKRIPYNKIIALLTKVANEVDKIFILEDEKNENGGVKWHL